MDYLQLILSDSTTMTMIALGFSVIAMLVIADLINRYRQYRRKSVRFR